MLYHDDLHEAVLRWWCPRSRERTCFLRSYEEPLDAIRSFRILCFLDSSSVLKKCGEIRKPAPGRQSTNTCFSTQTLNHRWTAVTAYHYRATAFVDFGRRVHCPAMLARKVNDELSSAL